MGSLPVRRVGKNGALAPSPSVARKSGCLSLEFSSFPTDPELPNVALQRVENGGADYLPISGAMAGTQGGGRCSWINIGSLSQLTCRGDRRKGGAMGLGTLQIQM